MITAILARYGLHLAIGAGVLVTYAAWHHRVETKAVEKERASVIEQGTKTNEKARSARRDAERQPSDSVRQWLRD